MIETKDLFEKIFNEKTTNDDYLRKQKVEVLSLDEFTVTRFIKEYSTVHEAADKLQNHLELLHHQSATEEMIEVPLAPGEKAKSAKPVMKVVPKAPHLYSILVSKLYGLNGQVRPHNDIVEHFL